MAMCREQYEERAKAYSRIVAKAWEDEAFKQRLLADPKATLQAEGLMFSRRRRGARHGAQ